MTPEHLLYALTLHDIFVKAFRNCGGSIDRLKKNIEEYFNQHPELGHVEEHEIKNVYDYLKEKGEKDNMELLDIYDAIGRKRNCLLRGNEIDYDRVINLVLYDLRHNKLGAMTYDRTS